MASEAPPEVAAPLLVTGEAGESWTFDRPFTVGRVPPADLVLDNARVSRRHLELAPHGDGWRLTDVGSANGTYVGGERVEHVEITGPVEVQVGQGGPMLQLSLGAAVASATPPAASEAPARSAPADAPSRDEATSAPQAGSAPQTDAFDPFRPAETPPPLAPPVGTPTPPPAGDATPAGDAAETPAAPPDRPPRPAPPRPPVAGASHDGPDGDAPPATSGDGEELSYHEVIDRYFGDGPDDGEIGERTRFIRQAYEDIKQTQEASQAKERSRYQGLIIGALVISVLALSYAGFLQYRAVQYRAQAQELFYQLKTFEVSIAQQVESLNQQIEDNPEEADSLNIDLQRALDARRQTAARYDRFVRDLGVYDGLSDEEELIYKTARAFGESELVIPPAFVDEVKVQIRYWQRGRWVQSMRHAQVNGYDVIAVNALRRHGMPPEFLFLAMQESNYDTRIVGPYTRYGHAKGAWQFIPETGKRYGLEPGPLVDTNQYDPQDERHDFDAAADAAARYLHDIYVHLAQASGLLVCASYNWGEGRIRRNMNEIRRTAMSGIANDPENRTYWKFLTTYRNRMPTETKDYVMKIFAAAVIGQNPRAFGIDMDPPIQVALAGGRGGIRVEGPTSGRTSRLGSGALDRRRSEDGASDGADN